MIDVSFIIVSWNAKKFLIDCIQSIEETTPNINKEIIVVDNASTDGSPNAVQKEFPKVKLILNPDNYGFAKANNIGLKQAVGRYVCLINSDVVILPDCVRNLVEVMDQKNNVGMVGPRILNADKSIQHSCRVFPSFFSTLSRTLALDTMFPRWSIFGGGFMKWWDHSYERKVDVLSGCFWFVRRVALKQVGGLDEAFFIYAEDLDWCKRFHAADWDVIFYPGAKAIHFGGASSDNAPVKYYVEQQKAMLKYWRKHHGYVGEVFYWFTIIWYELFRIIPRGILLFLSKKRDIVMVYKFKRSKACIRHFLYIKRNPETT
jgi:GT2 family glycosyltransferase